MIEELTAFLDTYRLGDLASIVGLAVALVGFALTIWAAFRSKTAAEAAAAAADNAREQLLTLHTTINLASVISRLGALKEAHRAGQWQGLQDRYSTLSGELAAIRVRASSLDEKHRRVIQRAIMMLRDLEKRSDLVYDNPAKSELMPMFNSAISESLDELLIVLHELEEYAKGGSTHV